MEFKLINKAEVFQGHEMKGRMEVADLSCPKCKASPLTLRRCGKIQRKETEEFAPAFCTNCVNHVGTIKAKEINLTQSITTSIQPEFF